MINGGMTNGCLRKKACRAAAVNGGELRMRLLLVEDDKLLGEGIYTGLCQEGYAVDWVRDGEAAESACLNEDYDCMVLDIGLPRQSGLTVLDHACGAGSTPTGYRR